MTRAMQGPMRESSSLSSVGARRKRALTWSALHAISNGGSGRASAPEERGR